MFCLLSFWKFKARLAALPATECGKVNVIRWDFIVQMLITVWPKWKSMYILHEHEPVFKMVYMGKENESIDS